MISRRDFTSSPSVEGRTLTGIAAVYDKPSRLIREQGRSFTERIAPGAFGTVGDVKLYYNHDASMPHLHHNASLPHLHHDASLTHLHHNASLPRLHHNASWPHLHHDASLTHLHHNASLPSPLRTSSSPHLAACLHLPRACLHLPRACRHLLPMPRPPPPRSLTRLRFRPFAKKS